MEIKDYISSLLYDNDCVIIPGFGAFVSEYKPAYMNESGEVLFPPSKEISFDSKLKNNDGLLMNSISASEGISSNAALKRIEEFRDNILFRLEKGEVVELEGLGSIKLDESRKAVFESETDKNFLLDAFGLNPASLKKDEPKPAPAGPKLAPAEPKPEKGQEKKSRAWMFFLLIPVAAIVVFLYLYFGNQDKVPENHQPAIENNPVQLPEAEKEPADSSVVNQLDTVQKPAAEIPEPVKKDSVPVANSAGKYYLMGGSFSAKENADKYMDKVEKMGYHPVYLGKQGEFFVVAVGLYNTYEDADAARKEYLTREPKSGIYIIKAKGR